MKHFHSTAVVQRWSHTGTSLIIERGACHTTVLRVRAWAHRSGGSWRIHWTGWWITNKDRDKSWAQSLSIVLSSPTAPPASSPGTGGTVHHDPRQTNTMGRCQDQIQQLFPYTGSLGANHGHWGQVVGFKKLLGQLYAKNAANKITQAEICKSAASACTWPCFFTVYTISSSQAQLICVGSSRPLANTVDWLAPKSETVLSQVVPGDI